MMIPLGWGTPQQRTPGSTRALTQAQPQAGEEVGEAQSLCAQTQRAGVAEHPVRVQGQQEAPGGRQPGGFDQARAGRVV